MESDSHANEKNHGVVDLLFECNPNECENYDSKNDTACPLNIAPRCDPFVSKDHRNSDLNVDSTRVTEENEIHDFISDLRTQRLKNARNILLGHVNINSIRNKFEPIEGILRNGLIDILVISESKIDDSFPMAQFSVQNYTLHRKDRNSKGGGLMIYIRSDIPHRRRTDIENKGVCNEGTEMMVCELQLYKDEKWFLCACYKPPRVKEKKFIDALENVCNSLLRESHHWLVVGDVNIDMNQENLLTSFCNTHDLENLVKGPTCFKGENPTCIDVILSNEPNRFKSTINVNCSLSDFHNIVCTATKLQCPPEYDRKLFYRSYRKFNEES